MAALHEELLPGIHLLSVANIKRGGEVSITTRWVMPLLFDGTLGHLRIPLTVGDVYGRSGLSDADELIADGNAQKARLTVQTDSGTIMLGRGRHARPLKTGATGSIEVAMDRPIDLNVPAWQPRRLNGSLEDGAGVSLALSAMATKEDKLTAAILVDKSGSMTGRCAADRSLTTHEATKNALTAIAETILKEDIIHLWEFDERSTFVGTAITDGAGKTTATQLKNLIHQLSAPTGGTRIDTAIIAAAEHSEAQDILVLTDGKSHVLDVDQLTRLGRRISAVLIGEDSLEARLGSLVVETGGQMFIASAEDIETQIAGALSALRRVSDQRRAFSWPAGQIGFVHNNLAVEAQFDAEPVESTRPQLISPIAVAAATTGLVLPLIPQDSASKLAVSQGVLTRQTSLILIDEAGSGQKGLPAFRKVPLARPRVSQNRQSSREYSASTFNDIGLASSHQFASLSPPSSNRSASYDLTPSKSSIFERARDRITRGPAYALTEVLSQDVRKLAMEPSLDWAGHAAELAKGDTSSLPPLMREMITWTAAKRPIQGVARGLGLEPFLVVLGLIALTRSKTDRHAKRLASHLLGNWESRLPERMVKLICEVLEL